MGLIPNVEVTVPYPEFKAPDGLTEGVGRAEVTLGLYDPGTGDERELIYRETVVRNGFDTIIYKERQEWDIIRYKSPPRSMVKTIESSAFVPVYNPGRTLKLMQTERQVFWSFTPMADRDNLSFRRTIEAVVVYTRKPSTDLDAEGKSKLESQGVNPEGPGDLVTRTALLWSEANRRGANFEQADANQSYRILLVEEEERLVQEVPAGWVESGWKKNTLRPGDIQTYGPEIKRRDGFRFRLPVEVAPPALVGRNRATGIRLEARGGGVTYEPLPGYPLTVLPGAYRFYRRLVSESRPASSDPYGQYETPTGATRKVFAQGLTAVDHEGNSLPAIPPAGSHVEPHDVSPPATEGWSSIGESDQLAPAGSQKGLGVFFDTDVIAGGVYEYMAVAVAFDEESKPSVSLRMTWAGPSGVRRARIAVKKRDGATDVDVGMSEDPALPSVGDTLEFDMPALWDDLDGYPFPLADLGDPYSFGDALAARFLDKNQNQSDRETISVEGALPAIKRGALLTLPTVEWDASTGGAKYSYGSNERELICRGWKRTWTKNADGTVSVTTEIQAEER